MWLNLPILPPLEFRVKKLEFSLGLPSEGQTLTLLQPSIPQAFFPTPPQKAVRKRFAPFQDYFKVLGHTCNQPSFLFLVSKNPCLRIKACTCLGSGMEACLPHLGWETSGISKDPCRVIAQKEGALQGSCLTLYNFL